MEKEKEQTGKDILWINYTKAISMILVYLVHSQLYYGYMMDNLNIFIHPFYVNSFFFVSGYLLFRKQLSSNGDTGKLFRNIFFRLVIPTVLFSLIEFLPAHVLRGREYNMQDLFIKTIGGCTYWFTSALVIAELLIAVMLLSRVRNIWFYVLFCSICFISGLSLIYLYPSPDVTMSFPWQYRQGLLSIILLVLGGLYWRYEINIVRYLNFRNLLALVFLYIGTLWFWPGSFHVLISMQDINIPGVAISLTGTLILIELCKYLPTLPILSYIGRNTIGIYFMSGALPTVVGMAMNLMMHDKSLVGLIFVFLISITTAVCATYFLNRFLPWVFDLRQIKTNRGIIRHKETANHVSHV